MSIRNIKEERFAKHMELARLGYTTSVPFVLEDTLFRLGSSGYGLSVQEIRVRIETQVEIHGTHGTQKLGFAIMHDEDGKAGFVEYFRHGPHRQLYRMTPETRHPDFASVEGFAIDILNAAFYGERWVGERNYDSTWMPEDYAAYLRGEVERAMVRFALDDVGNVRVVSEPPLLAAVIGTQTEKGRSANLRVVHRSSCPIAMTEAAFLFEPGREKQAEAALSWLRTHVDWDGLAKDDELTLPVSRAHPDTTGVFAYAVVETVLSACATAGLVVPEVEALRGRVSPASSRLGDDTMLPDDLEAAEAAFVAVDAQKHADLCAHADWPLKTGPLSFLAFRLRLDNDPARARPPAVLPGSASETGLRFAS
jgi:hypothetical protein